MAKGIIIAFFGILFSYKKKLNAETLFPIFDRGPCNQKVGGLRDIQSTHWLAL